MILVVEISFHLLAFVLVRGCKNIRNYMLQTGYIVPYAGDEAFNPLSFFAIRRRVVVGSVFNYERTRLQIFSHRLQCLDAMNINGNCGTDIF